MNYYSVNSHVIINQVVSHKKQNIASPHHVPSQSQTVPNSRRYMYLSIFIKRDKFSKVPSPFFPQTWTYQPQMKPIP